MYLVLCMELRGAQGVIVGEWDFYRRNEMREREIRGNCSNCLPFIQPEGCTNTLFQC